MKISLTIAVLGLVSSIAATAAPKTTAVPAAPAASKARMGEKIDRHEHRKAQPPVIHPHPKPVSPS